MRRALLRTAAVVTVAFAACGSPATSVPDGNAPLDGPRDDASIGGGPSDGALVVDGALIDGALADGALVDGAPDLAGWCEWSGAPGVCLSSAACSAMTDRTPEPTGCTSGLYCCIDTPNVADNPPIPTGWKLMQQSMVTSAMTTWAVMILHAPITYPMYSTTQMTFGTQLVMARVEWHPPDFQNSVVHRGVTLYVPV